MTRRRSPPQGVDAVGISGSGERPPPADEAAPPEAVSSETVFAAGSTALDLLLTLDERRGPILSGPASYLQLGDNLLPGWTVRVLALALILPALLAAGDVWLRDRRRDPRTARRAVPWALERVLLPLGALLLTYAARLHRAAPRPVVSLRPGPLRARHRAGRPSPWRRSLLVVALIALLVRPLRTPLNAEPQTLAAVGGLLCVAAVIGIWVTNPFMALLLDAPHAHLAAPGSGSGAAAGAGRRRRRPRSR